MRRTSETVLDENGDVSHPAFGVVTVHRSQGSGTHLFQSDVTHQHTIVLSVLRATRRRDLSHDWVHPGQELVQVEMSLAQWGAVVSSVGLGSGVPVTLRRTENDHLVDDLPHQPRIAANLEEVRTAADKVFARARETLTRLAEAIAQKKGVVAVREALADHQRSIEGAGNNLGFIVRSMDDAAEAIVSQVRADVEAHVQQLQTSLGHEIPLLPELTGPRTEPQKEP